MADFISDSKIFNLLETSLDIRMKRQSVIASNIANHETPGYRATDIDFRASLKASLGNLASKDLQLLTTDSKHISTSMGNQGLELITSDSASVGNDDNTVDIDSEFGKLEKNSMMYGITIEMLVYKFRLLKDILKNEM